MSDAFEEDSFYMRLKSLVRSFAAMAFALLFLMGALARPVLAQSDDDAASSPDAKGPMLKSR